MTILSLHGSRIIIAPGALASLGAELATLHPRHRFAIIADAHVSHRYGEAARHSIAAAQLDAAVYTFPPGEASKSRETWGHLTDQLLQAGFGRDSVIVALGGGVTGDLAGFVAATFMRGVPLIQVPTSLLAMIDAAIGGKTGVDTPAGKNLVGAFHHPSLVLVDPQLLRTLPAAEFRAGLAEAIKHGVIADAAYFAWIGSAVSDVLSPTSNDDALRTQLVQRSIEIKAEVVGEDERERGRRKILNFGHTIAHAIEHVTHYAVPHGEAVAVGMVIEARLAEQVGLAQPGLSTAIAAVCRATGLPVQLPSALSPDAILQATRTDKKARAGQVEYALPVALGLMAGSNTGWAIPLQDEIVVRALLEG